MKILLDSVDISGEMGSFAPDRHLPPKSKAASAREAMIAADADRVAGWVDALLRTIEGRRIHPHNEPAIRKLHADLESSTRSCLDQIGDLTLHVEEFDLIFEGRCVHHSINREGSLAVALHGDGVREITLRQGLDSEELAALVEILERATGEHEENAEGIVTLLWERDIAHIDYVCAPFEEWEPEPRPEGGPPASGAGDDGFPWPTGAQEVREPPGGPGEPADERSDDWPLRVHEAPFQIAASSTQPEFTQVEAANLMMLAKIEEVHSPRERVMEIVSAALVAEEDPEEFLQLASILARLIEHAVRDSDLVAANQLVDRLESVSSAKTQVPGEFQAAANRVLQGIGQSEFLRHLGAILARARSVDLDALTDFLARLGPAAAPTLCDLLGEVGDMKIRRAICEALAISCKNDVDLLIKRLSDPRWFVVRNILYILGRIAHQGVERALGDALYHSDARVRREAVRAMGEVKSPASRAYLNSALRDPDKTVRMMVAGALAERNDERAARIIWGVIESPEFPDRDSDERMAFFEALGITGSDALVPRLEQTLTRGGLFQSRKLEGRTEAAMALAWLGTPAALAVLRREADSRKPEVRRAVTEALEALRKATPKKRRTGWDHDPPSGRA